MKVKVLYFALLRERRGLSEEEIEGTFRTVNELYEHLDGLHRLGMAMSQLRAAVNGMFVDMGHELTESDTVVFIPPVAGG
ncbi:MAG: MoaD/ThiS family protein [Chthonomonadaceae bacterium]|jgi:molybdopterin converting factor subunit 1|nr:MoaD/ThiS family protein [Chthonomonadaceae bacterium]